MAEQTMTLQQLSLQQQAPNLTGRARDAVALFKFNTMPSAVYFFQRLVDRASCTAGSGPVTIHFIDGPRPADKNAETSLHPDGSADIRIYGSDTLSPVVLAELLAHELTHVGNGVPTSANAAISDEVNANYNHLLAKRFLSDTTPLILADLGNLGRIEIDPFSGEALSPAFIERALEFSGQAEGIREAFRLQSRPAGLLPRTQWPIYQPTLFPQNSSTISTAALLNSVLEEDHTCQPPDPPLPPDEDGGGGGGHSRGAIQQIQKIEQNGNISQRMDPLVLDLDGGGVQTTSRDAGIYFDHDATGLAYRTAWVGEGDGFLVLDRSGDGIINDGSELFGESTTLSNGQLAHRGFDALADLDSNGDGKIDASDPAFSALQVLRGDGTLLSLSELEITSLGLEYANTNVADEHGNVQPQLGSYTKEVSSIAGVIRSQILGSQEDRSSQ